MWDAEQDVGCRTGWDVGCRMRCRTGWDAGCKAGCGIRTGWDAGQVGICNVGCRTGWDAGCGVQGGMQGRMWHSGHSAAAQGRAGLLLSLLPPASLSPAQHQGPTARNHSRLPWMCLKAPSSQRSERLYLEFISVWGIQTSTSLPPPAHKLHP